MNPRTPWPESAEVWALCRLMSRHPPAPHLSAVELEEAGSLVALAVRVARRPALAASQGQLALGVTKAAAGASVESRPPTGSSAGRLARERTVPAPSASDLHASLARWRATSGGALLSYYDAAYPQLLRHIARPPAALFVRGDPEWLQRPAVAIVGARAASAGARAWARDVAADLARCGVVVVSGMARGIDAAAHAGALQAGGATVAVLGCGPDRCYPSEHADLSREIVAHGCVASEFPPGTPPLAWHFPMRNRILAGLVSGVVVVQAEPRSGALITARQALEENRQVMAVPGDVSDPRSRGPHRLLREGATLVEGAADILEGIGWLVLAPPPDPVAPTVGADLHAVLAALGAPMQVETLRDRLGWSPERLQRALSELEVAGMVACGGGLVQRAPSAPSW